MTKEESPEKETSGIAISIIVCVVSVVALLVYQSFYPDYLTPLGSCLFVIALATGCYAVLGVLFRA